MSKSTSKLVVPNSANSGIILVYLVGDICSGKGTQSRQHSEFTFSFGQWARAQRDNDMDFANIYGPIIDAGDYLPDPVIFDCLESLVPTIKPGCGRVAIDGIRTPPQAVFAAECTEAPDLSLCIDLRITEREALRRARERFKKEKRHDDFDRKTVLNRYGIWDRNRDATIRAFRRQGVRIADPVDGSQPLKDVTRIVGGIIKEHVELVKSRADKPRRCKTSSQVKPAGQHHKHH